MSDVIEFLKNITGDEKIVKESLDKINEISKNYELKGDPLEIDPMEIAWAMARLLPGEEEKVMKFLSETLIGGDKHPQVTGHPDTDRYPRNTPQGQWVGDSSRSAVWINDKLEVDEEEGAIPYSIWMAVIPWAPACRGGAVPAGRVSKKEKEKEKQADATDFSTKFSDDPYSPIFLLYKPFTDYEYEEICDVQKEQLIATTSGGKEKGRKKIKHHRNIE